MKFKPSTIKSIVIVIVLSISAVLFALILTDCLSFRYYKAPKFELAAAHAPVPQVQTPLSVYSDALKDLLRLNKGSNSDSNSNSNSVASNSATGVPAELTLKATIVGDTTSVAIFDLSGEKKLLYEGDEIAGMRVVQIESDRVILSKSDNVTITAYIKYGMDFSEPSKDKSTDSAPASANRIEISKREFEDMLNPPSKIAKDIVLAPFTKDGNPYGLRMNFVRPGSFMEKMGFRTGDILLSMNNKQLLTPEDGMLAYQTMKNEDSVVFNIERGTSQFKMNIIFK